MPFIALSLLEKKNIGGVLAKPSETDKFLSGRSKNTSWKNAKNKREFWLFLFSFAIIIGIARMVDENANYIGVYNSKNVENNQRTF